MQRVVLIYDHTGKLYGEIHLAPRELPAADPHQCCCLQLQVRGQALCMQAQPCTSAVLLYQPVHVLPLYGWAQSSCPLIVVLQWDASGETLVVLPAGCSFVYTWTVATKELQKLETDFKVRQQAAEMLRLKHAVCTSIKQDTTDYRGSTAEAKWHSASLAVQLSSCNLHDPALLNRRCI